MLEGIWNRSINQQAEPQKETGRKISRTSLSKTQPEKQKELVYVHEMSLTKHTYKEPNESENQLQNLEFETEQSEAGFLANGT